METETAGEEADSSLSSLVATVVTSATMITAFGLLAAGQDWFWVIFIIGFAGVLPIASTLANWYESRSTAETERADEPLDVLRERYATGEIGEAEFERRLDSLLETESESDARQLRSSEPRTDVDSLSDADLEAESLSGSSGETTSVEAEVERERDRD